MSVFRVLISLISNKSFNLGSHLPSQFGCNAQAVLVNHEKSTHVLYYYTKNLYFNVKKRNATNARQMGLILSLGMTKMRSYPQMRAMRMTRTTLMKKTRILRLMMRRLSKTIPRMMIAIINGGKRLRMHCGDGLKLRLVVEI